MASYNLPDASTPSSYGGGDWFDANPPAAQGGGTPFREAIRQAYIQYLKREPSEAEISSHLNGVTTEAQLALSIAAIRNSPEAAQKAAAPAASAAAPSGDVKGTVQTILAKYPPTPQGLRDAMKEINAIYPKATISGGSGGDLDLSAYGLGIVDVMIAAGAGGGRGWQWDTGTGSPGSATLNPNAASYDAETFGSLRKPFTETYAPAAWKGTTPYTGPSSTNVAPFAYPAMTPTADFVPPTADQLYEDPSYRVRFDEGVRAVDASAAARGNLMTGGTLKALTKYGGEQASKEYQNVYNRSANTWGINAGKNLAEYQTGFGSALSGWGVNTGQTNTQFNQGRDTWGMTNDAAYRDWLANYNAKQEGYKTRYGVWNDQRNFDFNNLYKLSALGASAV
jgi:hypothetical protein